MPQATSRCCTPAIGDCYGDCYLTTVCSALHIAFYAACRPAAMTTLVTRCFQGSAYCDRVSDTGKRAKETKMNRSQRDLTHRLGTTWKQNIGFGASKSVPIQVKQGITFRRAKCSFVCKVSAQPDTQQSCGRRFACCTLARLISTCITPPDTTCLDPVASRRVFTSRHEGKW